MPQNTIVVHSRDTDVLVLVWCRTIASGSGPAVLEADVIKYGSKLMT